MMYNQPEQRGPLAAESELLQRRVGQYGRLALLFLWMGMADLALIESKETAKAAQAFADYVNLGPTRSLRKLVAYYHKNPSYLTQVRDWSVQYNWQDRLRAMAAEQLGQAVELKTTTYVNILGEYHRRISDEPRRQIMELNSLHGIYDRVKPEIPSTPSGLDINVTLNFFDRPDGPS